MSATALAIIAAAAVMAVAVTIARNNYFRSFRYLASETISAAAKPPVVDALLRVPLGKHLSRLLAGSTKSLARLDQKCSLAGRPWGITGTELWQITWVGCGIWAVAGALLSTLLGFTWLPGVAIGLGAGFIPRGIVDSAADTATKEMTRRLPQFLDLLVLADQAGVEQVAALQLAAAQTAGALGNAVGTAVSRVMAEKKDVTQVFGALAETTQIEAIQDLATALAISQKYSGATYSMAISAQAERMRIAYRQTVEKKINTLSTTMMLPVGLFIMPAILLIIIGPMLPAMARGLGGL